MFLCTPNSANAQKVPALFHDYEIYCTLFKVFHQNQQVLTGCLILSKYFFREHDTRTKTVPQSLRRSLREKLFGGNIFFRCTFTTTTTYQCSPTKWYLGGQSVGGPYSYLGGKEIVFNKPSRKSKQSRKRSNGCESITKHVGQ